MVISITSVGSCLVVDIDDVVSTIQKVNLELTYNSPNLELTNNFERVFRIDDHSIVITPESTDIEDLRDQIAGLMNMSSSGSGEVTSEAITDALGYTPANAANIAILPALNRKVGGIASYSLTQVRAFTGSDPLVFQISGLAGDNLGVYDNSDDTSTDDGATVIVSGTRRYKVITVIEVLNKLVAALDIFKPNA